MIIGGSMNQLLSRFFKSILLSSVLLAILGLLLIFQSEITIFSISYIIGGVLVAIGVFTLLSYVRNINHPAANELNIIYGAVTIILGVLIIKHPKAIASVIPLIIGTIIVVNSAAKLQYSLDLKKNKNDLWKTTMGISILTILCGTLLIFNPFVGAVYFTKIVGVLIFVYALLDIISTVSLKNTVSQIHDAIEEGIKEADITEEDSKEEKEKPKKTTKKRKKTKKES